ncbi:flagellar hook-associated protein FlgL [Bacillus sporothermodurans]|uniref:flagellar hook-associated protein FlgL n=1 Tax=Heyndrickxia sporothermodurans TaxID=46224 RepID=UPI00192B3666|nr:flagellar hook-associated protein FlgL [Heyndrickxia sporothermodurans]MBL5768076.1 flagellar hook-associated protein FlgL [Heyndrickxia sporothermodurans]MBL5785971.1 flagellar hook-associated protein FlgL [Heyndrickxia sporothermodurans]MBL5877429.1 flagellar hook-associated protein FlgL [Heyndrickxia sporothermodurans]MBL5909054.1 flagellar hook-associated protein FlgL [Heyndrickxia sporothermodurans]
MRVTQSMISNNVMFNINQSYSLMDKLNEQMTTQKKISRPSDDPVVAMKGMFYRTNVMEIEQFKSNFSEARNWVDTTDSALSEMNKALQRIREITVSANNGTYDKEQTKAVADEVSQLKEHIASIANSKVGDKYIFNGSNTLTAPVQTTDAGIKAQFSEGNVNMELSKGIYVPVNINGTNAFMGGANGDSVFTELDNLEKTLRGEGSGKIGDFIQTMDDRVSKVLSAQSEIGARTNRLDFMEERIDNQQLIAKRVMSDNEDIDFEKLVTDFKTQEAIHRAAMEAGARIIQPTLLDFLR